MSDIGLASARLYTWIKFSKSTIRYGLNIVIDWNGLFTIFRVFFYFIYPFFSINIPILLVVIINISSESVALKYGLFPISIGKLMTYNYLSSKFINW